MADENQNTSGDNVSPDGPVKKKRGNPNFKKGQRNPNYPKKEETTDMADNEEHNAQNPVQETTDFSGAKKEIPNDIFSEEIPKDPVLPLDGELNKKDYATLQEGGNQNSSNAQTSGPTNPNGTTSGNPLGAPSEDNMYLNGQNPNVPPGTTPGPQQPLPGEDVKTQAEQMVRIMFKGYEKLHGLGRWAGKIDEQTLANLHATGKIDLDFMLPLGRKNIAARDFFADYNQSIDEDIVVDPKFKEDITPPLVRIAIKRGWTLGDEAYVAMAIAEDLGTKVSLLIGMRKATNLVLEALHTIMAQKAEATKPKNTGGNSDFVPPSDNDGWREAPVAD